LFFKTSLEGARETKEMLAKYCNASWQCIKMEKSSISLLRDVQHL
jgi:hypothetical protein